MRYGRYFIEGDIVNLKNRRPVAHDVPVFLLLATDKHAAITIARYAELCTNPIQKAEVLRIAQEWQEWQQPHPDRVHEPDHIDI